MWRDARSCPIEGDLCGDKPKACCEARAAAWTSLGAGAPGAPCRVPRPPSISVADRREGSPTRTWKFPSRRTSTVEPSGLGDLDLPDRAVLRVALDRVGLGPTGLGERGRDGLVGVGSGHVGVTRIPAARECDPVASPLVSTATPTPNTRNARTVREARRRPVHPQSAGHARCERGATTRIRGESAPPPSHSRQV